MYIKDDGSDLPCKTCPGRTSRLCSAMEGDDIAQLYAIARRVSVENGAYLFNEEDRTGWVFNLHTGMGILERLSSDGRRQIMAFLFPGDFLGLMPDEFTRVGAKALRPMVACQWHIRDLDKLMESHPELEHRLRRIGMRVLATTMDQVFVLGCKSAKEKLAWFLMHMERRQQMVMGDIELIHLPMTRVDIADFLGVTVETVSRVFSQLRREKLIELPDPNEVRILDHEALEDIAEYEGAPI